MMRAACSPDALRAAVYCAAAGARIARLMVRRSADRVRIFARRGSIGRIVFLASLEARGSLRSVCYLRQKFIGLRQHQRPLPYLPTPVRGRLATRRLDRGSVMCG